MYVGDSGIWSKPVFNTIILGLAVQSVKYGFPQMVITDCSMIITVVINDLISPTTSTDVRFQIIKLFYKSINH